MSPYLSDHALVAYMLVGAPVLVWLGEMAVRRFERWLWSPRRSRVATHRLAVNDAMRRHPAGTRVIRREIPAPAPAYGTCNRCDAPVWVPSVHAQNCRVQPLRANRWV